MNPDDLKMTRGGVEYDAKAHKREVDDAHDILSAWEKRLAKRKSQGLPV